MVVMVFLQHTDLVSGLISFLFEIAQDLTRSELKAETLLTRLLRDKLFSKDQEVEQLEAELATAARGNDILRCEVQNAHDSLSCATHKMKELELQVKNSVVRSGCLGPFFECQYYMHSFFTA